MNNVTTINVLLADDDIDDRFFFDKALNEISQSTKLTTVGNGEELMNYLSRNLDNLPDILFLDLNMPCKNGFECLYELKDNEKLKSIPVIIFSTFFPGDHNYEQGIIETLKRIGAKDYIRKPEDFASLKEVINNTLTHIA